MFVREIPIHSLNPAGFSLYTDVIADLISFPVMGARDLIFLKADSKTVNSESVFCR